MFFGYELILVVVKFIRLCVEEVFSVIYSCFIVAFLFFEVVR